MARILITSGPTRQYIDPVRYISNASSGQMGAAMVHAAIAAGHEVVVVSGPVHIEYPKGATVIPVMTTEELLHVCRDQFPLHDGMIGVAAPCDYRPVQVASEKIKKTGQSLLLELVETEDVVASMGQLKTDNQWLVGFALETVDARVRALTKLQKKCCDLIVLNGPDAIDSHSTSIEVIDLNGEIILSCSNSKQIVANRIVELIDRLF